MGFQTLKRSYTVTSITGTPPALDKTTENDEFKSVYIGFEFIQQFNESLKLFAGFESPVYSWGEAPLKSPARDSLIFKTHAGIIWTFGE
jgi:hypothetical protein